MIFRVSVVWGVFILLLCSACSTSLNKQDKQVASNNFPHWLNDPALEGHLTVTASAMPQNIGGMEGQRRAALLRARAELAKNTRVFVNKSFTSLQTKDQITFNQQLSIRAIELQQLTGANVRAEWIDPASSELFIWYVIPIE